MRLELGFVSICLSEEKCSPAGTLTVTAAGCLPPAGSSIPAIGLTHPPGDPPFHRRVGLVGLTGPKTFVWAREYMAYHERLFALLDLADETRVIMHLGGGKNDKGWSLRTARENLDELSDWARSRLVLENDDRTFTAEDVLSVAVEAGIPVVFDWHHHLATGGTAAPEDLVPLLKRCFATWKDRPPKVYLSSPQGAGDRAHADAVDPAFIQPFGGSRPSPRPPPTHTGRAAER